MQFYLLAPLLARVFQIASAPARRIAIMGLMLLPMALGPLTATCPWLDWTLLGKLQFFMAGFLFCDLYLNGQVRTEKRNHLWDFYFIGAIGAVVGLSQWQVEYNFLPWLWLVMLTAAFRGRIFYWLLGQPLITTIGGMCYTIYMYHWLMISGLIRLTIKFSTHIFWLDLLIQFVLMSAIIIAICSVLFALFERPFMQRNWPQKFWNWATRNTPNAS